MGIIKSEIKLEKRIHFFEHKNYNNLLHNK